VLHLIGNVAKTVRTFSCYNNVDELVGPYVGCFRHINGLCMFFFQENCHLNPKLMWKGINISIQKRQDHNTKNTYPYQGLNMIVGVIQGYLETWRYYLHMLHGFIHDWGMKKECLIEKGLQMITLDFSLSYIIMTVVYCCMPIDKMMFF